MMALYHLINTQIIGRAIDDEALTIKRRGFVYRKKRIKYLAIISLWIEPVPEAAQAVGPAIIPKAARIGGGIGMLGGFAVSRISIFDERPNAIKCVLIFGAIGASLGALLGAVAVVFHNGRGEEVPVDRLRVGVSPQRQGGLGLSASFSF